jgi:hypothetical protein
MFVPVNRIRIAAAMGGEGKPYCPFSGSTLRKGPVIHGKSEK